MGFKPTKSLANTGAAPVSAKLALLDELPALHPAAFQLFEALSDEDLDRNGLAVIIDKCPALAARLVGLANSAYFKRTAPVGNVSDAIFVIGFRTVRSLAIATAVQEPFTSNRCPSFQAGRYWMHATLTAHVARELARKASSAPPPDDVYLAALLHGIGLLALVHLFPDAMNGILGQTTRTPGAKAALVLEQFGATHHTVGAALLKRWHLPEPLVCTTEHFADPDYDGPCQTSCRLIGLAHDWADRVIHREGSGAFAADRLALLGIAPEQGDAVARASLEQFEAFRELAELISGEPAVIPDPAKVADPTVELKDRLVDTIEALSSLSALTELDTPDKTDEALLRGALKVLMENQDMQRCSVFLAHGEQLLNAAGLSWVEQNTTGQDKPLASVSTHRFKVGEGLIGLAAQTGEIQHCRDTMVDLRFKRMQPRWNDGPRSLISVPICFHKNMLGVLNISHEMPDAFSEWDERFLLVFCNLLGQLLNSNRLLRNMEHQIEQRTMELQSALERAESLSVMDALTGVHNRRYFIAQFSTLVEQCDRFGHKMSVLMLDIDDFKQINDNYGHLEGDRILKRVADTLTQCARGADIIARFGGEEFVIALQNADAAGASRLATRIQQQISVLRCGRGAQERAVSISIGISWQAGPVDASAKTAEQWIQEADDALYRAKHAGKNRICLHGVDGSC